MFFQNDFVTIDDSEFPLVIQRFTGQDPTPQTFDGYLEALLEISRKGEKFVMLVDATRAQFVSADYRLKMSQFMDGHEELIQSTTLAYAFVIRTLIVRFMLNAILKTQRLPAPHRVFDSREKARRWAEEQLQSSSNVAIAV